MDNVLYNEFTKKGIKISDTKLKILMQAGLVPDLNLLRKEALYDFKKIF